jgi:phosphoadenosine phosphosulfate reductase
VGSLGAARHGPRPAPRVPRGGELTGALRPCPGGAGLEAGRVVHGRLGLTGVEKLRRLEEAYGGLEGEDLIRAVALGEFPGRAAVASSFGAESAVLLAMVARVAPALPVLFLETGMLFEETLDHARELADRLGLLDVRWLRPEPALLAANDPDSDLWITDPEKCCYLRKVRPFRAALHGFDCWIAGLKRAHGGVRGDVQAIELEEGRIKLNPLAAWSALDIARAFRDWGLPRHPLVRRGYRSIGCVPCTRAARPGEDPRSGRWEGRGKTECGIHSRLHARSAGGPDLPDVAGPDD